MGCFQPRDASAHTSYLIMLLKSGPRDLAPGRPTIIQVKTAWSTDKRAFIQTLTVPPPAREPRIIRSASGASTVFGAFLQGVSIGQIFSMDRSGDRPRKCLILQGR
jgi:hypothetical protein